MRRFLVIIFALFLISCAQSGKIERRIGEQINRCKPDIPCVIKIKDLTDFTWDEMHVFEYGASLDEIEKEIGTSFPNYVEFTRRLVFLNDGKIVHREDEPTNIERPVNGKVSFAESFSRHHWFFTPDEAVFIAEKRRFDSGVYYILNRSR
jgi:hypothetical protein